MGDGIKSRLNITFINHLGYQARSSLLSATCHCLGSFVGSAYVLQISRMSPCLPLPLPVPTQQVYAVLWSTCSLILYNVAAPASAGAFSLSSHFLCLCFNMCVQEAGIDMGGLLKEFLESVITAGFDPDRGLFKATPDGCAYPNPLAERLDGGLAALETMGLVLGRALYEGVLLDLPLAPFFVSRMQVRRLCCFLF